MSMKTGCHFVRWSHDKDRKLVITVAVSKNCNKEVAIGHALMQYDDCDGFCIFDVIEGGFASILFGTAKFYEYEDSPMRVKAAMFDEIKAAVCKFESETCKLQLSDENMAKIGEIADGMQ